MREIRAWNLSSQHQHACNEYERTVRLDESRQQMPIGELLALAIATDLDCVEFGFDFGVLFIPDEPRFNGTGTLSLRLYPRDEATPLNDFSTIISGYPLDPPPRAIEIQVNVAEDSAAYWGLIAGVMPERVRDTLLINPGRSTAHERRMGFLRMSLAQLRTLPLFVEENVRHTFLTHVINLLMAELLKRQGNPSSTSTRRVQLSAETRSRVFYIH